MSTTFSKNSFVALADGLITVVESTTTVETSWKIRIPPGLTDFAKSTAKARIPAVRFHLICSNAMKAPKAKHAQRQGPFSAHLVVAREVNGKLVDYSVLHRR